MIKIAIVEDEFFEREAIKLLISRADIPIKLVYETDNGADAVLLYKTHKPDLIFMDIEMPILSGLEAAKKIREIDKNVDIVMLTAYNEFTYAQQAIKAGVLDYLLKPYNTQKLYEVIQRSYDKLATKQIEMEKNDENNKMLFDVNKYFKKEILCYMVVGLFLDDWSYDFYNEYFCVNDNVLRCILFRISKELIITEKKRIEIQCKMESEFPGVMCNVLEHDIVCIKVEGRSKRYKEYKIPESVLDMLPNIKAKNIQSYCESTNDIRELPMVYQRLKEKMNSAELKLGLQSKNVMDIYILESELNECVLKNQREQLHQILINLTDTVDKMNKEYVVRNRAYFSYLWRGIDRYIFQLTGRRKSIQEKNAIDFKIEKAKTALEMANIIEQFIFIYINELEIDKIDSTSRVIEHVKEYVKANLANDISLESVAEEVGYSSFHLSKIFKKTEGINFKDFVIKNKMEKAKLLFRQGNLNVSEVCKEVGYPNASYFSKVFREYYGVLPKEYSRRG
ncbi:response regulator [Clostridium lacusfryxellense]|uniref:response regulator n=1 Tax=Clostridium lacusfryxellense TaxID=205328 RepID=UPI001C0AB243|nr:response regulator [Clostridium lacusfryxellense]MBU3113864.1 response regulator [Clostridium lacusfryxellense]